MSKKNKSDKFSSKIGENLGQGFKNMFSNKIARYIILGSLILLLILIIPIRKNLPTLIVLALLFAASIYCDWKTKHK